jgi:hypothetical protein
MAEFPGLPARKSTYRHCDMCMVAYVRFPVDCRGGLPLLPSPWQSPETTIGSHNPHNRAENKRDERVRHPFARKSPSNTWPTPPAPSGQRGSERSSWGILSLRRGTDPKGPPGRISARSASYIPDFRKYWSFFQHFGAEFPCFFGAKAGSPGSGPLRQGLGRLRRRRGRSYVNRMVLVLSYEASRSAFFFRYSNRH